MKRLASAIALFLLASPAWAQGMLMAPLPQQMPSLADPAAAAKLEIRCAALYMAFGTALAGSTDASAPAIMASAGDNATRLLTAASKAQAEANGDQNQAELMDNAEGISNIYQLAISRLHGGPITGLVADDRKICDALLQQLAAG